MAFSMNRVILIGNLGKDPEIKTFPSGGKVMNFSVATTQSKKDGNSWKDETTWHNVSLNMVTDYMEKNLRKGTSVVVEGRLANRQYEKDGQKLTYYFVNADKVQMNLPKHGGQSFDSQVSEKVTQYAAAPQSFGDEDVPF